MSTYSISPATAGPSHLHAVSGVWEKKSDLTARSEVVVDVVARLETPPPDFAHSTLPYTVISNEHRPPSFVTAPPPYAPRDYDAGVYADGEPLTLARMLFLYGFFFFPFWLAGVYILCSPLLPTPDWEAGKTEDEKAYLLHLLRETELKWSRRCLYALHGLLVTAFILFIIIKYGIMGTI